MSGKEAARRLRAVGFEEVRHGKHLVMERPAAPGQKPLRIIVASGGKISPRAERGVKRLLDGRPTLMEKQGHRNLGGTV